MIDLTIHSDALARTIQRARDRQLRIPTYEQMRDPRKMPADIRQQLQQIGLWDIDPLNLFRITWHNEPTTQGGDFGGVNYLVIPSALSGVSAKIVMLLGKWFPTGAHKVGAAFGCLVPRLVTGQFDPTSQKAAWPSTGNYCRGGAYDSALLGCHSIAILPAGMSQERFAWLEQVADEIIKTPGSESNVKEIFDKCHELRQSGEDIVIFNQFDELGNYLWHYSVTGFAMHQVLQEVMTSRDRYQGLVLSSGSAGTLASGDYLKQQYPTSKIAVSEAIQCPTLLYNGFGAHRIEGIGDKHVPWIHNVRHTDMVIGIDDDAPMQLLRLFNEEGGCAYLAKQQVPATTLSKLDLLGISGIANLLSAIKFARYYELTPQDVVLTVATDSMAMYGSRLTELAETGGALKGEDYAGIAHRYLWGQSIANVQELTYYELKRIHNLKYFTWVEQQGKSSEELQAQWFTPNYWENVQQQTSQIDQLITAFNNQVLGEKENS